MGCGGRGGLGSFINTRGSPSRSGAIVSQPKRHPPTPPLPPPPFNPHQNPQTPPSLPTTPATPTNTRARGHAPPFTPQSNMIKKTPKPISILHSLSTHLPSRPPPPTANTSTTLSSPADRQYGCAGFTGSTQPRLPNANMRRGGKNLNRQPDEMRRRGEEEKKIDAVSLDALPCAL